MAQTYYSVFTQSGLALLTEAIKTGSKLGLTHMAFGDGNGNLPEPDSSYTKLINEVYRTSLNALNTHDNNKNWLVSEAIISSAIGGFNIRELGLYAGDTLVAYSNYPPTYKPTAEDGTARISTFRMIIQIDNSSNFELIVDSDVVLATRKYVEDMASTKVNHVEDINALLNEPITQGKIVYMQSYRKGQNAGGDYFKYDEAQKDVNNGITIFNGWIRQYKSLDIFDAGAYLVGNNVSAVEIANNFAKQTGNKITIPDWFTAQADNSDIDTKNFIGGNLKQSSTPLTSNIFFKKNEISEFSRFTLEDEFGAHSIVNGQKYYYSGFGSSVGINGKEYYVVRTAIKHARDAANPSQVYLYTLTRDGTKKLEKTLLYTAAVGDDVRDINISIDNRANGVFALVKFAELTPSGGYRQKLLYVNIGNSPANVVANHTLDVGGISYFTWGNTLVTPSGKLLVACYSLSGKIYLFRSTNTVTETALQSSSTIPMSIVWTNPDSNKSYEPTIGYWDDKLVMFYRKDNGVNGKYAFTYDLEGGNAWSQTKNLNRELHAPAMPTRTNGNTLYVVGSLGNKRDTIVTFATQNLVNFYDTATLKSAGGLSISGNMTAGYPSFTDNEDKITMLTYSDLLLPNGKDATRIDLLTIQKKTLSAEHKYTSQAQRWNQLSFQDLNENPATSGDYVYFQFGLKKTITIKGLKLKTIGSINDLVVTITDQNGNVIGSTNPKSLINTEQVVNDLTMNQITLEPGLYTLKIPRSGSFNIIGTSVANPFLKKNIVKSRTIDILDFYSSSNQNMGNNYISTFDFIF
ncbi:TPA: phage tail protein [Acinetobacter baumannii]|nr:phage tail protein [Acinetobacter baumannii]